LSDPPYRSGLSKTLAQVEEYQVKKFQTEALPNPAGAGRSRDRSVGYGSSIIDMNAR